MKRKIEKIKYKKLDKMKRKIEKNKQEIRKQRRRFLGPTGLLYKIWSAYDFVSGELHINLKIRKL